MIEWLAFGPFALARSGWLLAETASENPFITGGGIAAVVAVTFYFVRRDYAKHEQDQRECRDELKAVRDEMGELRSTCQQDAAQQQARLTEALIRIATLEAQQQKPA